MSKKKSKGKSKKKFGVARRIWRFLWKTAMVLFIFSILITILYKWINPPITPLMVIRKVQNDAPIEKKWKSIDKISYHLVDCAVASEDNFFLAHNGIDLGAIEKAIDESKKGKRQRGASTISQQTAKNVFLWPQHSWVRKGLEVYFTGLIEIFWSKERIMEVYLNIIEMGNGIYGAEAASQHYFHKSAANLSLYQAALITACYPAPLKRNPAKPTAYLAGRASHISALTLKIGRIRFDDESIKKAEERFAKHEEKRKAKKGNK